jgi:acyl carrier protein
MEFQTRASYFRVKFVCQLKVQLPMKRRRQQREGSSMQVLDATIQERIVSLVTAILERNSIVAEVTPVARLVDIGLTSMDMVNLMLGVEAEFDFTIPQSEITPENFQSVETLQRMIASQLGSARAA